MQSQQKRLRLAQSVSALGVGISGFGFSAQWGNVLTNNTLPIIIAGTIFHLSGLYIKQIKDTNGKAIGIAKSAMGFILDLSDSIGLNY